MRSPPGGGGAHPEAGRSRRVAPAAACRAAPCRGGAGSCGRPSAAPRRARPSRRHFRGRERGAGLAGSGAARREQS